jgi:hypothetical protein
MRADHDDGKHDDGKISQAYAEHLPPNIGW